MKLDEERRLLERCRRGQWEAFEALFKATRVQAHRLAFRLTGSQAEADDLLEEVWVQALKGIPRFSGRARFGTWLWRIMLRVATDSERRRGRRVAAESLAGTHELKEIAASDDPAQKAAMGELNEALNRALESLPLEQRAALVLVSFERMSYAEAAKIQRCPEGTLAWRVAEARRRVAEKLAPYLEPTGDD